MICVEKHKNIKINEPIRPNRIVWWIWLRNATNLLKSHICVVFESLPSRLQQWIFEKSKRKSINFLKLGSVSCNICTNSIIDILKPHFMRCASSYFQIKIILCSLFMQLFHMGCFAKRALSILIWALIQRATSVLISEQQSHLKVQWVGKCRPDCGIYWNSP